MPLIHIVKTSKNARYVASSLSGAEIHRGLPQSCLAGVQVT